MPELTVRTCSIANIDDEIKNNMFRLFSRYYGGVSRELFMHDLAQKHYALIMEDHNHALQGFTTMEILSGAYKGEPYRAIFSGDTIIDKDYWGTQTLPLAWCEFAGRVKKAKPDFPLYWFLIVKGHRTYRYLSAFKKKYYPNRSEPTPENIQDFMDYLAKEKFGTAYNRERKIIHFEKTHGFLKPEWAMPGKQNTSPNAAFFFEKNPGYAQGTELVCLSELSEENLRSFALTGFQKGLAGEPLE